LMQWYVVQSLSSSTVTITSASCSSLLKNQPIKGVIPKRYGDYRNQMKLSRKSEEHRHRRNQQMAEAQRLLEHNCISESSSALDHAHGERNKQDESNPFNNGHFASIQNEGISNVDQESLPSVDDSKTRRIRTKDFAEDIQDTLTSIISTPASPNYSKNEFTKDHHSPHRLFNPDGESGEQGMRRSPHLSPHLSARTPASAERKIDKRYIHSFIFEYGLICYYPYH